MNVRGTINYINFISNNLSPFRLVQQLHALQVFIIHSFTNVSLTYAAFFEVMLLTYICCQKLLQWTVYVMDMRKLIRPLSLFIELSRSFPMNLYSLLRFKPRVYCSCSKTMKCTRSDNDSRWAKTFHTLYLQSFNFLCMLLKISCTGFTTAGMYCSGDDSYTQNTRLKIYIGPRQHRTMGNKQYR